MRVVLDTNILVSACWKPGGNEDVVLELGLSRKICLVATAALWAEYQEVLGRRKFQKHESRIGQMLVRLHAVLDFVDAVEPLQLARDPDDNLVLECALAAKADCIVTGNLRDFPLDWDVARIWNARQFLDVLATSA